MFPKLISVGSFYLPTYGVLVAAAFLVGLAVTARLARETGADPEKVTNLAVYGALAGLLGAKIFMFLFDWQIYAKQPGELFSLATLQSAGVFQGGVVFAFLTGWWLIRRDRLPVAGTLDLFAPGLALGHGIGRLGCFAAGCCWGVKCDRPWAVTFNNPEATQLTGVPLGQPLHPTQLYEAIAEVIIFALLYRLFRQRPRPGTVMGLYLVLYSVVRFFVEFLRNHQQSAPFGGPLSNTQWISAALAALGLFLVSPRPASAAVTR
jgi:phosphatidylglycerol:prolipoprotein diacylglycerol transferase